MAASYAAKHGLRLDKNLSFRDIGVSAFHSANQRRGALAVFLAAVDAGIVEHGSYLLVESFDRLSRDQILSAQALFLQIIQAGITLVTLIDERTYAATTINENPYELLISLVSMMRANEESAYKSERLRQAWVAKRAKARDRPLTSRCPAWLRLNPATRAFEIDEEKGQTVRRIYDLALAGAGRGIIAKELNRDGVLLLSGARQGESYWMVPMIRSILTTPAAFGTLVPHQVRYLDGKRRFIPLKPIANYYPAVVTLDEFAIVQRLHKERLGRHRSGRYSQGNIFAWLARCPVCKGTMRIIVCTQPHWRYLVCSRAFFGGGCVRRTVRYPELEDAFVDEIETLIKKCPRPKLQEAVGQRLRAINRRIEILRTNRADIIRTACRSRSKSRPLTQLKRMNAEFDQLSSELSKSERNHESLALVALERRLDELELSARTFDIDRARLNLALRSLFDFIEIDYRTSTLRFGWRHGGKTSIQLNSASMTIDRALGCTRVARKASDH